MSNKTERSIVKQLLFYIFSISLLISCGGGGGGGGGGGNGGGGGGSTNGFTVSTIDSTGDVGLYSSIAAGSVHISYYDSTNDNLKYAYYNGSSWSTPVTVDGDATDNLGWDTSIALDASDYAHISYYDDNSGSGNLKYAYYNGASWQTTTLDGDNTDDVGWHSSLALDSAGYAYISYYDATASNWNLMYITNAPAGAWSTPAVIDSSTDAGEYSSLALDASDYPHIAYYDSENGSLKYIYYNGASWSAPVTIDGDATDDVGQFPSMALDSYDYAHISYYDADNGNLMYIYYNGISWSTPATIDGDASNYVGWNTSLVVDSSDYIHIAYYDASNGNLKYATNASGSWVITTVDSSADVGEFASLAVEAGGTVHISYYDNDNGNLKYATK